jgi:hypothetical protein
MSSTRINEVDDMDGAMAFMADSVAWNEAEVQKVMVDTVELYQNSTEASFTDCLIEVLKNIYL